MNPSEEYVKALKAEGLEGVQFSTKIIQVNTKAVSEFVDSLEKYLLTKTYDAVIMMGVAGDSSDFRIELLAKGIRASLEEPVDEEGIPRLLTTLNMSRSKWLPYIDLYSFDAGSYYCNQLYYDVLRLTYQQGITVGDTILPVVFIHVPPADRMSSEEGIHRLKSIIRTIMETSYTQ